MVPCCFSEYKLYGVSSYFHSNSYSNCISDAQTFYVYYFKKINLIRMRYLGVIVASVFFKSVSVLRVNIGKVWVTRNMCIRSH